MKFKKEVLEQFEADAESAGDRNYCTLKALCAVTNWNYRKCVKHLGFYANRKYRDGCFPKRAYHLAFPEGGVVDVTDKIVNKYGIKTIRSFEQNFETVSKCRYIIEVDRHVAAFVDGELRDWATNKCSRIKWVLQFHGYPKSDTTKGVKMKRKWKEKYIPPRNTDPIGNFFI